MSALSLQAAQLHDEVVRNTLRDLVVECIHDEQIVIKDGVRVGSDDGQDILAVSGGDITINVLNQGANGVDHAPPLDADTWYYIWLIKNLTTGIVAGLVSKNAASPDTMPAGYTEKRLIGAVRSDATSDFIHFYQIDNEVFIGSQTIHSCNDLAWTSIDISATVPEKTGVVRLYARCTSWTALAQTFEIRPTGYPAVSRVVIGNDIGTPTSSSDIAIEEDELELPCPNRSFDFQVSHDASVETPPGFTGTARVVGYSLKI